MAEKAPTTQAELNTLVSMRNLLRRQLIGKNLKCKMCESPQAWISLEDKRYFETCPVCGYHGLLKLHHI